jgi:undecaprenyl-diphosphatase
MLEYLLHLDKQLFLILNGIHNDTFDFIMYWVSSKELWIPLYLFFIYILYRSYGRGFWLPLILVIFTVGVADFVSVKLFKEVFERLRPCHDAELIPLVHLVKGKCGGSYGFVSSHATNMFSLATILWLLIRTKFPKSIYLLIPWAALIGYSRIYLGVHYPGDVLGGSLLGIIMGFIGFKVYQWLPCSSWDRFCIKGE